MRFPGIADAWEDCSVEAKARLIKYDQIRTREEADFQAALVGAKRV